MFRRNEPVGSVQVGATHLGASKRNIAPKPAATLDSSHQSKESRSIVEVVKMPMVVPAAKDLPKSKSRKLRRVMTQPVVSIH